MGVLRAVVGDGMGRMVGDRARGRKPARGRFRVRVPATREVVVRTPARRGVHVRTNLYKLDPGQDVPDRMVRRSGLPIEASLRRPPTLLPEPGPPVGPLTMTRETQETRMANGLFRPAKALLRSVRVAPGPRPRWRRSLAP